MGWERRSGGGSVGGERRVEEGVRVVGEEESG